MSETNLVILGLGSRSTAYYLSQLNKKYNQIKGGYSTCPLLLLNVDFNSINSLLPYISEELDHAVNKYLVEIKKQEIQHVLVPNITLHETIDGLEVIKNIIHPVYLSIQKAKKKHWNKIVLFGSLFSMNSDYIKNLFKVNEIEVILPSQEDMVFLDEVRKQIYNETETKELILRYHSCIEKYSKQTPVILSCTELSILKPKENNNLLDMAEVQINEAINLITS